MFVGSLCLFDSDKRENFGLNDCGMISECADEIMTWVCADLFLATTFRRYADGEKPRTRVDLKVSQDASHQHLSVATLRFDLALGMSRKVVENRTTAA